MPRNSIRSLCFASKTPSFSSRPAPLTPGRSSHSQEATDRTIVSAATIITKWNAETSGFAKVTSLFYESKREAMEFIKHVNDLQKSMDLLVSVDPNSEKLVKAHNLMQIAMKRLQKEFYQILSMNQAELDPESVSTRSSLTSTRSSTSDFHDDDDRDDVREADDSITEMEDVSSIAMADLRSIAECMIPSGYAKECLTIYKIIRKSIIDEGIYRLGVEKMSSSEVKNVPWEVLEMKIKKWLEAVRVSMRTLFSGERILCDHVLQSSDSIRESCFSDISREGAMLLFGFPEIIITKSTKNSPAEKIFRLLDMYTAITENWKEIESIFSFKSTSAVRSQALNSMIRLSESARLLLADFVSGVQKDSSKTVDPGNGVYPLTISAMNYLSLLADYSTVLADILAGSPLPERSALPESYSNVPESDNSPKSELSIRFAWLVLVLLCKIDGKAKRYKDFSPQYLFLANNLQYVVSLVRASNLKHLLGDEWISRHVAKVKQFVASYERLAWEPVVASLPKNLAASAGMSPGEAKERFENFNLSFEIAYRKQSACVVPDPKLRDEIKISIARKLLPVYRGFYATHKETVMAGGKDVGSLESVVRFAPEDICNYLSDLFFGTGSLGNSSSSSHWRHSQSLLRTQEENNSLMPCC